MNIHLPIPAKALPVTERAAYDRLRSLLTIYNESAEKPYKGLRRFFQGENLIDDGAEYPSIEQVREAERGLRAAISVRNAVQFHSEALRRLDYRAIQTWAKKRGITSSLESKTFETALRDIDVDYDALYLDAVRRQRSADSFSCSVLAAILSLRVETIDDERYVDWYEFKEVVGVSCGCGFCDERLQRIANLLPKREHDGWLFINLHEFVVEVGKLMSSCGVSLGPLHLWV